MHLHSHLFFYILYINVIFEVREISYRLKYDLGYCYLYSKFLSYDVMSEYIKELIIADMERFNELLQ